MRGVVGISVIHHVCNVLFKRQFCGLVNLGRQAVFSREGFQRPDQALFLSGPIMKDDFQAVGPAWGAGRASNLLDHLLLEAGGCQHGLHFG